MFIRLPKSEAENQDDAFFPDFFLAKTERDEKTDKIIIGLTVKEHSEIVAEVAMKLYNNFPFVSRNISKTDVLLGAYLHDVGKISLPFQKEIWGAIEPLKVIPGLKCPHAEISAKTIEYILKDTQLKYVVGNHHGQQTEFWPTLTHKTELFGGEKYYKAREDLVYEAMNKFGCFQEIKDNYKRLLSGLVTVSDWIGSSISKKEYELKIDVSKYVTEKCQIEPLKFKENLSFFDVFGFEPNSMQKEFIDMVSSPGIYIVESQMGSGKTEAALYAAYKLISEENASGLYFAMPTCLTSLMIYHRTRDMLHKVSSVPDNQIQLVFDDSIFYKDDFINDDERSWFDSKKRALLAPVGVGTIDQALMSVILVKHSDVRLLGLSGKVVILDEVHSYDFYTTKLIYRLAETLRDIGCTVIILSATLTTKSRYNFLSSGCDSVFLKNNYPLLSGVVENNGIKEIIEKKIEEDNSRNIKLKQFEDVEDVYQQAVDAAKGGQYVLWIENTVTEAQNSYRILSERSMQYGVETGLIHSSFTKSDRKEKEEYWTSVYGKKANRYESGYGKILVGTQVLEQSLDLDSDLLVSHICPIDMLLQRIGRLYRHEKFDSIRKAKEPVCCIIGPYYSSLEDPLKDYNLTGLIYEPYYLARTSKEIECLSTINIPTNIRTLIDNVYSEESDNQLLKDARVKLEQNYEKMSGLTVVATSPALGSADDSKQNFTRYVEFETLDVLLLNWINQDGLKTLDGKFLDYKKQRNKRDGVLAIKDNIVSVHLSLVSDIPPISQNLKNKIRDYMYVQDEMRVVIIDNNMVYDESGNKISNLYYSSEIGFERLGIK